MDPYWFDESYYLTSKVNEARVFGGYFENANALKVFLAQMGTTPYQHFITYGANENLNPNIYFNQTEYLAAKAKQMTTGGKSTSPADVAKIFADIGITAAQHYADWGWKENLNPSNNFDTSLYLSAKQAQINAQPGTDAFGKPYAAYTIADTMQSLDVNHIDPVGHFVNFGFMEQLSASLVPLSEQVAWDLSRPIPPTLSSDGKTITLTFPSPLLAESIELADFSVFVGNQIHVLKSVAKGTDYSLVLTLETQLPQDQNNVQINYNPYGGLASLLACERGQVAAFSVSAINGSTLYNIVQTLSSDSQTVFISTLPNLTALSSFNIDMSSTTGVVSVPPDGLGIVSPPLLENGALVQNLNAYGVNANISLNITARIAGGEITSGQGADNITLGAGADQLNYNSYTASRLSNLDSVQNFVLGVDKVNFTGASMPVFAKNILNLAGVVSEATINSILATEPDARGKAFLIKDGTSYLLLINDQIDRYEASKDFLLRLENFTYTPNTPLSSILGVLGTSNPSPQGQTLLPDGKTLQILFGSPLITNSAELEDFSITVNGVSQIISKVTINKDYPYILDLLLEVPHAYTTPNIQVSYNPNGGAKSQLACESGLVNSFNSLFVQNQSAHYYISEMLQGSVPPYTLLVSAISNPNSTTPSSFNIDMSATDGVVSVSQDQLGILSSPRLMDGTQVNHLDASGVDRKISLNITARLQGGDITSGQGSDTITLGDGVDHVIYAAHTSSQLNLNMDTISNFDWGKDKIKFTNKVPVADGTILNLAGIVTEASINAALNNKPDRANTAFLLMDGESYILIVNDANPIFEAGKDFTLRLENLQNLPADPAQWGTDFFI